VKTGQPSYHARQVISILTGVDLVKSASLASMRLRQDHMLADAPEKATFPVRMPQPKRSVRVDSIKTPSAVQSANLARQVSTRIFWAHKNVDVQAKVIVRAKMELHKSSAVQVGTMTRSASPCARNVKWVATPIYL